MPRNERHVVPNPEKGSWDSKRENEGLEFIPNRKIERMQNSNGHCHKSFSINTLKCGVKDFTV
jgi:hypothetical protein